MQNSQVLGVPYHDLYVDENQYEESIVGIAKVVRPEWQNSDVHVKVFTGGISNKLLGCYVPPNKDDMLLARIYGKKTELLIDRKKEMETFQILHKAGCGPKLYASFQNGICYEYVPGVTLDAQTVVKEEIYPLVARLLARMHTIKPEKGPIPPSGVFDKIRRYITYHPDEFQDPRKNELFKTKIMSRDQLNAEVDMLESVLTKLDSPVVFAHNDLLLGNVIYNQSAGKVFFIDYEYAEYNYLAYDIGNHFCEFVGIDEVDYNLYPSKEFQMKWLKLYLQARHAKLGENRAVTQKDLERLYAIVNKFALAAHFFWGVWAVVQAYHSTIDFYFMEYAIIRFDEYKRRKEEFLALPIPE